MTTVLSVGNSAGERRCDARCHEAHEEACECVCGGWYHGAGRDRVLDHVAEDILGGAFGEAVALEGASQLGELQRRSPETVRFHARDVAKALARRAAGEQTALEVGR